MKIARWKLILLLIGVLIIGMWSCQIYNNWLTGIRLQEQLKRSAITTPTPNISFVSKPTATPKPGGLSDDPEFHFGRILKTVMEKEVADSTWACEGWDMTLVDPASELIYVEDCMAAVYPFYGVAIMEFYRNDWNVSVSLSESLGNNTAVYYDCAFDNFSTTINLDRCSTIKIEAEAKELVDESMVMVAAVKAAIQLGGR